MIIVIVVKNSNALDYVHPILIRYKEIYPSREVLVLYLSLWPELKRLVTPYYYTLFREKEIKQYRLSMIGFSKVKLNLLRNLKFIQPDFALSLINVFEKIHVFFLPLILRILQFKYDDKKDDQDIILLDNTTTQGNPYSKSMYKLISSGNKKVILLPHAAHHASTIEVSRYLGPLHKSDNKLRIWNNLQYFTNSTQKNNLTVDYIGYPIFDDYYLKIQNYSKKMVEEKKVILVLLRRFEKEANYGNFICSENDILEIFQAIEEKYKGYKTNFKLSIKPHPSLKPKRLFSILKNFTLEIEIAENPFFIEIMNADEIWATYSTAVLFCLLAGKETSVHKSVNYFPVTEAPYIGKLYSNLNFNIIGEFTTSEMKYDSSKIDKLNRRVIREFFLDGAVERGISSLEDFIE